MKSCIRRTNKVRNIPDGTAVNFRKSWYFIDNKGEPRGFNNSYMYKVKNSKKFDPEYEINRPSYLANFTSCERSQKLTEKLRDNGFIVSVTVNTSFISNMLNSALTMTGKNQVNAVIKGETAIAYGFGKKIGFSSFDDDFMGYSDGCENILWDKHQEFDKWSKCMHIEKNTNDDAIEILKEQNIS